MTHSKRFLVILVGALVVLIIGVTPFIETDPIKVGNRLELFVDDYLIDEITGDVHQRVLKPEPREVVLVTDKPWEGNTSSYFTVFQDGDTYRMFYRGWHHDKDKTPLHNEVTSYAESKDGIRWTKPNLGLFAWNGSKENNIVWQGRGRHNFTPFRDGNPAAPDEARYKAVGGRDYGLLPFQSSDSKHWQLIRDEPVITNGTFDSQNLAFWDADRREYRAYWRYFSFTRVRSIRTATSKDFITWEDETDLTYSKDNPGDDLYTNAIQKYFRAPHLFIGLPTRYDPKSEQVEPVLITSRDGKTFRYFSEAVIPPTAPKDRNHNRSNYMAWGMLQLPGKPNEISVYASENYFSATPGRLRRFVYRVDGFVALRAGIDGGRMTTKPLRHNGQRLLLNYAVRKGGTLMVEILDESGDVIGKSAPLTGDAVDAPVSWQQDPGLGETVIVRLRFNLKNADVFSFRFD